MEKNKEKEKSYKKRKKIPDTNNLLKGVVLDNNSGYSNPRFGFLVGGCARCPLWEACGRVNCSCYSKKQRK